MTVPAKVVVPLVGLIVPQAAAGLPTSVKVTVSNATGPEGLVFGLVTVATRVPVEVPLDGNDVGALSVMTLPGVGGTAVVTLKTSVEVVDVASAFAEVKVSVQLPIVWLLGMTKVKVPVVWLIEAAGTVWVMPQPEMATLVTRVGLVTVPVTVLPRPPEVGEIVTLPVPVAAVGVTELEALEAEPVPAEFVAVTVKV